MNKTEYNTIMKYLEKGKTKEIKKYLDKRLYEEYLKNASKALMNLINLNCIKDYPSYYERVELHKGVTRIYRGIFEKTENGFVIADNNNSFELYDQRIITPSIEVIRERTADYYDAEQRKHYFESLKLFLSSLDKEYQYSVLGTKQKDDYIKAWAFDEEKASLIPIKNYRIAHRLLGEQVEEYVDDEGYGLYLKSPNGKARIKGIK